MFLVSLVENVSSEGFLKKEDISNFYVPINLIEFKVDAKSINSAFSYAKRKLSSLINSPEDIEYQIIRNNSLMFSFGNKTNGLMVTYKIHPLEEKLNIPAFIIERQVNDANSYLH